MATARSAPQLLFKWLERGFPPRTVEASGDGLKGGHGRRLIEQLLPYTLSAEATYEPGSDSLYCTIRLPIKAKDEHGPDRSRGGLRLALECWCAALV